ncbi:MAG: type II toxin-antitoxin system prevent-host-death family antitoxin [Wenzhouxiangella sp.]|nr:type II toxin-antitoxin system prevent-host-death family antitoxin [Wenzhouxiangella sp.]MCH8479742.1 type II toxin-antitoxin system prevent-host-death family antitoxin [Wenzhouxiangella sp.]
MPVSIRELKAHLSQYLAEARAGKVIRVTSHRKEIARITGVPDTQDDQLARLLAAGEACWRGGKPAGARIRLSQQSEPLSQVVLRERG